MDRIAFVTGETVFYWNSILLTLAAAVAICFFLAFYLGRSGNAVAGFAVIPVSLVLSLVLVQFLGLYGIILGTVLAGLLSLVMILGKMKKNYGLFPEFRGFLGQYLLGNLIMAVSILAVLALKKALPVLPGPGAIGLYGVATLAIFLLTAYLFRAKALQVRL